MIHRFKQQYPGIAVRLISSIWVDELADDETDIDLRLGFGNWPGCQEREVLRDRVVPVCRPDHPLFEKGLVGKVDRLRRSPLIHVMGIEDLWMKYFQQAKLELDVKDDDLHVDSAIAAIEIAATSDAIGLIQKRFLPEYLASNRLAVLLDIEMEMEQKIYLVQPEARREQRPEAILFSDWLSSGESDPA